MSNRKPGDYVVNAELTTEQIERFVADCVEAGAKRDLDDDVEHRYTSFYTEKMVGTTKVQGGAGFRNRDQVNNVTDSYKAQPMTDTPDLPTVLEECAEHLRAGRDIGDYFEGTRRKINHITDLVEAAASGCIRRKPQTITINGVEVPAPERVEPERYVEYWALDMALRGSWGISANWQRSETGLDRLKNGQVYLNKSDRDQAAQAIIKALRGEQ